jgi:hypothetical protein
LFYIGGQLDHLASRWMDNNFTKIAEYIGPRALIIRGLTDSFDYEVMNTYKKEIEEISETTGELQRVMEDFRQSYGQTFSPQIPLDSCLIITDRHPNDSANSLVHTVFYFIPLSVFDSETELNRLFRTAASSLREERFEALNRLLSAKFPTNSTNLIRTANEIVELKPGILGLSFNLNKLIDALLKKRSASSKG